MHDRQKHSAVNELPGRDSAFAAQVRSAVQHYTASAAPDPYLAQRVLNEAKENSRKSRRVRPVRIALIAMLFLLGTTAMALETTIWRSGFMKTLVYNFFRENRYFLPFRSMTVFNWLLEAAVCGGLLILVFFLFRPLVRKIGGKRSAALLWVLVAVRLLLPVAIPNPLMNELRPSMSTDAGARPIADQIRVRLTDAISDAYLDVMAQYPLKRAEAAPDDAAQTEEEADAAASTDSMPTDKRWEKWQAIEEFNVVTSYGWTGQWVLVFWAGVSGAVMLVYLGIDLHRRRKNGSTVRVLAVWTVVRHVCTALQWFNPIVWVWQHWAKKDVAEALDEITPAPKNKRILCAALAVFVMVCSFCCAEYKPGDLYMRAYHGYYTEPEPSIPAAADMELDAVKALTGELDDGAIRLWVEQMTEKGVFHPGSLYCYSAPTVFRTENGYEIMVNCGGTEPEWIGLDKEGRMTAFQSPAMYNGMMLCQKKLSGENEQRLCDYVTAVATLTGHETARHIRVEQGSFDTDGVILYRISAEIDGQKVWLVVWYAEGSMELAYYGTQEPRDTTLILENEFLAARIYHRVAPVLSELGVWEGVILKNGMLRQGDETGEWEYTVYLTLETVDDPQNVRQRFGEQADYVLRVTVTDDGRQDDSVGEIENLGVIPALLTDRKPVETIEAPLPCTAWLKSEWGMMEYERIPIGTVLEVLGDAADCADSFFAQDETQLKKWLCVRYVSPTSGETVERWINSAHALQNTDEMRALLHLLPVTVESADGTQVEGIAAWGNYGYGSVTEEEARFIIPYVIRALEAEYGVWPTTTLNGAMYIEHDAANGIWTVDISLTETFGYYLELDEEGNLLAAMGSNG